MPTIALLVLEVWISLGFTLLNNEYHNELSAWMHNKDLVTNSRLKQCLCPGCSISSLQMYSYSIYKHIHTKGVDERSEYSGLWSYDNGDRTVEISMNRTNKTSEHGGYNPGSDEVGQCTPLLSFSSAVENSEI